MSAVTVPRIAITSDLPVAAHTSFVRLLRVEARKLVDTLTGRVLVIVGVLLSLAAIATNAGLAAWLIKTNRITEPLAIRELLTSGNAVVGVFLAVLGILTICGEWTQRTHLTTFALEPRRGRVLTAKILILMIVTTGLLALSVPVAYAATAIAKSAGVPVVWTLPWRQVAGLWLTLLLGLLVAAALALLLRSPAAALISWFLMPMIYGFLTTLSGFWKPLATFCLWTDPNGTTGPLMDAAMNASAWRHLAVAHLLWVILPGAVGLWRWLRSEVK